MKVPFFSIYFFFISVMTWAQLPAEGILRYQVDTVRRLEQHPGSMRLTDLSLTYKDSGKFTKLYAKFPDGSAVIGDHIVLFRAETAFMIFHLPSSDSLLVMQMPDQTPSSSTYELVRTQETKRIESLLCQKWLIRDKRLNRTFEAWVVEQAGIQIPLSRYLTKFEGIEGLPVEFDLEMAGWQLHAKLQKIDRVSIDSKAFEISDGKHLTFDDLLQEIKDFH